MSLHNDLHIDMLRFVAGHGTVVQPACIDIVFGCKQAQQCSRTHQLGFIRAVRWSVQNGESHWSHVHITLIAEDISCMHFIRSGGTKRLDVLFKLLHVKKTINIFLARFHFLKKLQIFLMLLGIMHAAPPLAKSTLISSYKQQKHLA